MTFQSVLGKRPWTAPLDHTLAGRPSEQVAVVTCMDCRIPVLESFGLELGEAHVIRNAGAAVTDDVIRSLSISQRKLGTRGVLLMAHTGCGMATFTDDDYATELATECGSAPAWAPETFADPADHVRDGLKKLRTTPFLHPDVEVRGFVIDLQTGAVDEIT